MPNSTTTSETPTPGWRWAPAWVLAFVALWPAPGYAEGVLVLGALVAIVRLLLARFRGGMALLSGPAWALTCVLFAAYWLPELVSALDAVDRARALKEAAVDLRYLPFLWLAAAAVGDERGRRITFGGLAVIVAVWTADALLEALGGTSPLFFGLDALRQLASEHPLCLPGEVLVSGRLTGVFGDCNPKLGLVLASLAPFALQVAHQRFAATGWVIAATAVGLVVLLAGARAAWLTYALVLLWSGWRTLGGRRLAGVFLFGALALGATAMLYAPLAERLQRTATALAGDAASVDHALSGRGRIWGAAWCMFREHPLNGVGARGFREAFPACDPQPGEPPAWGEGPALHAHQLVLEVASETGSFGLLLWLAGAALAWRAWRYAPTEARTRAQPAMIALAVTAFPLNTHLAFYATFWGGVMLLLAALYVGSLLARPTPAFQS